MKKSIFALAVLSAFSGAAFAQSTVTIYGVVDVGFQSLDNGTPAGRFNKLQSGQEAGSRIGFKGVEDLGGGLKANFVLEQGVQVDTGESDQGRTFGRRSTVGLSGDFGAVDFGRDKSPTLKYFDNFDPFGSALVNNGNGVRALYFVGGSATVAGVNANSTGRVSNSVFYYTPGNLSGFSAAGQYGFGEAAGNNSAGRSLGLTLGYKVEALEVGFNYLKDSAQDAKLFTNAKKGVSVAASYNFGVAKPVFIYQKTTDDLTLEKKAYTLAVTVPVDANSKVYAGFTQVKNDTPIGAGKVVGDAKQFAIAYNYNLSKRTDLYAAFARLTQDSTSRELAAVNGASVKELTAGVRHQF